MGERIECERIYLAPSPPGPQGAAGAVGRPRHHLWTQSSPSIDCNEHCNLMGQTCRPLKIVDEASMRLISSQNNLGCKKYTKRPDLLYHINKNGECYWGRTVPKCTLKWNTWVQLCACN